MCHAAANTGQTALTNDQLALVEHQMERAAFQGAVAGGIGIAMGTLGAKAVPLMCGDGDCTNEATYIFNRVIATGPAREGTQVPRSFVLNNANGQFWVHPNATKHMAKILNRGPASQTSFAHRLLLESFDDAVTLATRDGQALNRMTTVNGWDLVFSQRANDLYPVIIHALYHPH